MPVSPKWEWDLLFLFKSQIINVLTFKSADWGHNFIFCNPLKIALSLIHKVLKRNYFVKSAEKRYPYSHQSSVISNEHSTLLASRAFCRGERQQLARDPYTKTGSKILALLTKTPRSAPG